MGWSVTLCTLFALYRRNRDLVTWSSPRNTSVLAEMAGSQTRGVAQSDRVLILYARMPMCEELELVVSRITDQ